MKRATNRNGQVYIKLALLAAIAVCLATAVPARAVLVTTNSTTSFYDNFENVTVGSLPSASVGGWIFSDSPNAVVSNAVPPGAAEGDQYLKMPRIGSGTTAAADFGSISSGSLQASFSLFIPTDAPNDLFSVLLSNQSTNSGGGYLGSKVWLTVQPQNNNNVYYNDVSLLPVDTGIDYVKGVWQTWQIDYNFVPGANNDQWTISVGGITSAPLHGGFAQSESSPELQYLNFYTGANNSEFFLDAVPIPEPSVIGLLATGLLVLRRFRSTKQSNRHGSD